MPMPSPSHLRPARPVLLVPAIAALLALAGCAQLQSLTGSGPSDPLAPDGGKLVMTLQGSGTQQFQCASDQKGRWWKFIAPDVKLVDGTGRTVAHQGPDFIFRAGDGSVASARIVNWDKKPENPSNLRDVLFALRAQGKTAGVLTGIRWVSRTEGQGGQPLTRCSASQTGTTLKVPFTATYRLYR